MDECIFQLNKEIEANIVNQKEENLKNMIMNDYVLKLLIEHNYQFFRMDGGGNYHSFRSLMSQARL